MRSFPLSLESGLALRELLERYLLACWFARRHERPQALHA